MPSKQADRRATKKDKREDNQEPEPSVGSGGGLLDAAKAVFMGSCIVQVAPKVPAIVKDLKEISGKTAAPSDTAKEGQGKEIKEDKVDEDKENKENVTNGDKEEEDKENRENATNGDCGCEAEDVKAKHVFNSLVKRLAWHNALGLASSGEESAKAWIALKGLERDWGPRNKGRNVEVRIAANFKNNLAMYVHMLLALMVLRAFLFRSFFACLPWLCVYQLVSLILPLVHLPKVPQVPLEKIPIEVRVLATIGLHALLWLFFVYEAVWKTWFFEKIPIAGLLIYHAYAVRPIGS